MQYACIAPTAYLDQYAGRGHFQLCLAQVAMRDAAYFEWYKRRREAGDFVILDNGAYEGELVTFDELCRVASELKPNVVTVPDKINNAEESHLLAKNFLSECFVHLPKDIQLMRVLQHESREPHHWDLLQYDLKKEHPYRWVALPRILGDIRPAIIKHIFRDDFCPEAMHVHAFGWTGNLNEVRQLAKLGVTSIDTSAPVWRGLQQQLLKGVNDIWWEENGTKFDPSYPWSMHPDEHSTIQNNLQAMQRACVAF